MKKMTSALTAHVTRLRSIPRIGSAEESELARRWVLDRDPAAGRRLIESHLMLVWRQVREFGGYGVPLEDLLSAGHEGLMRALGRFQLRGVPFRSYARYWIRAYLFEAVLRARSVTSVKNDLPSRYFFLVRSELIRLRALHGPDLETIRTKLAQRVGVPEGQIAELMALVERRDLSLDVPMAGEGDEPWLDHLSNDGDTEDAEEVTARRQVRRRLHETLQRERERFDAREWATLVRRLLAEDPETLDAIGRDLGISRERVRQIEAAVLRRLRRILPRELAA